MEDLAIKYGNHYANKSSVNGTHSTISAEEQEDFEEVKEDSAQWVLTDIYLMVWHHEAVYLNKLSTIFQYMDLCVYFYQGFFPE